MRDFFVGVGKRVFLEAFQPCLGNVIAQKSQEPTTVLSDTLRGARFSKVPKTSWSRKAIYKIKPIILQSYYLNMSPR